MRTKTLLAVAAAAVAGIATSNAQVFSVNAVGYVNTKVTAKSLGLISNPLIAATNTIAALFGGNDQIQVFFWDTGSKSFKFTSFDATFGWDPADVSTNVVMPGGGVFVKNPTTADMTITFVGEVPQGSPLHTPLVAGLQIVSSQVPQAGILDTDLGYKAAQDDKVYQWNQAGQKYSFSQFDTTFGWDPALGTLGVGEAIFLSKTKTGSWDRTFNVNQ